MRTATKDQYERETEESDRLVRPAPKYRDPRRDKRRERMHSDRDPDTDGDPDLKNDPDLSLNYKTIGGSSVDRVVLRHLLAMEHPTEEAREKYLKDHPAANPKNHTVKETEDAPASEEDEKVHKTRGREVLDSIAPDENGEQDNRGRGVQKAVTKALELAEDDPDMDVGDMDPVLAYRLEDLGFKTVGEVAKALKAVGGLPGTKKPKPEKPKPEEPKPEAKPEEPKPEAEKPKPEEPKPEEPKPEEPKPEAEKPKPEEPKPEEPKPEAEKPKPEEPKPEEPKPEAEEPKPEEPKPEEPKPEAEEPKPEESGGLPPARKAKTRAEQDLTQQLAFEGLPTRVALQVIRGNMHPDDVQEMIKAFKTFNPKDMSTSDVHKLVKGVREAVYETDPDKVPPPKTWKNKPFNQLSPEERASAMQAHRTQVLAMSMAAHNALTESMRKRGLPGAVAGSVADFTLGTWGMDPKERTKAARKSADRVFSQGLSSGAVPEASSYDEVMSGLSDDPDAQMVATAMFEAADYRQAKDKYLGGGDDSISERHTPDRIARGIRNAVKELRERSLSYEGSASHDVAGAFRHSVLRRLKALDPTKFEQVRDALTHGDDRDYEKARSQYDAVVRRLRKEHETRMKEYREKIKALEESSDQPYRDKIPPQPVLRLPPPPRKPAPANVSGRPAKKERRRMLDELRGRTACVSFYPPWKTMERRADYHGVAPYPPGSTEPYPEWGQARPADLGEEDYSIIVAEAERWLGEPILSDVPGFNRDTRLRAALDQAIKAFDGGYDRVIDQPTYDLLLSRLSGRTAGNRRTETRNMNKFSKDQANTILARIDRIARDIQKRRESWGMPFADARNIVNALDRTADEIEIAVFGKESFERRQAEVIQREPDEGYMDTFNSPTKPIQTDADEPYMGAYADDQTTAVNDGKSTTGRPLNPYG